MDNSTRASAPTGGLEGALRQWLGEGQVDDAAAQRSRQHWLAQQLESEATVPGVLVSLGESASTAVLSLPHGNTLRVTVVAVGADVVVCANADATAGYYVVPLDQILRIETADAADSATGSSPATGSLAMWIVLAMLAEDRPEIRVHHGDGTMVAGQLRRACPDHLVLTRPTGDAVVPLLNVAFIVV